MHDKTTRRTTKKRTLILQELRKVTSHPTAEQVHQMVRQKLPGISIATVYRNLEILSDEGEVLKLEVAGTQRRFDGTPKNHYHIRCSRCGKVDDVHIQPLTSMETSAARACGYQVHSHTVEFEGICPDCASPRRNSVGESEL